MKDAVKNLQNLHGEPCNGVFFLVNYESAAKLMAQ